MRKGSSSPAQHAPGDHGALQQVAAELGKDAPDADLPHPVSGPSDPLQPPGDGARGLHQQDLIHRPHVDAHLQGTGGDDGAQLARA